MYNVRNFRRFLFGISIDVPALKVYILQVTLVVDSTI